MKHKFKLLCAVAALGILATGCSKDGSDTVTPPVNNGEKGFIQLTVSSLVPDTKAGAQGAQTATAEELAIIEGTGKLKVAVFTTGGIYDYAGTLDLAETTPGSKEYKSTPFEVTAGDLYFFVFANDVGDKITLPTSAMDMNTFMKQAVPAVYSGTGAAENMTLDIATDNRFLLGSLWQVSKLAAGGGTSTAPKTVELTIGRLSSKVNLNSIDYTSGNAELKGAFSAGKYRLGTLAKGIHTVGVHTGTNLPYGSNTGVLVTSQKHNSPYVINVNDFNSTDFAQYTAFQAINGTNMFYATENTTARDESTGQQYFGNTSYIQVETVYTPKMSEVYDPADIAGGALGTDATDYAAGTFWTGIYQGKRLIFNANPNTNPDVTAIKEYTDGLNYHKFPIFDPSETDAVYKNRVLRNHYYEFDVTKINDLGSHTKDVDPKEPIPDKTTVDVKVTVANWDKVKSGIELQ